MLKPARDIRYTNPTTAGIPSNPPERRLKVVSAAGAAPDGDNNGRDDPTQKPRVLVVDDEKENLDYLARCLRERYRVDVARSGEEGIELLRANDYDAVLSDQRMPGLSGSEFLAQCLKQAPSSLRIIVTAYSDWEATLAAINDANVSAFLKKPFSPDQVIQTMTTAASRRAAAPEPQASGPLPDSRETPFRRVLESMPDAVAVARHGRLVYVNRSWTSLLSCTISEGLLNRPITDFFHPDDHAKLGLTAGSLAPTADQIVRLRRDDQTEVLVAAQVRHVATIDSQQADDVVCRMRPLIEPVAAERIQHDKPRLLVIDQDELALRSQRRMFRRDFDVTVAVGSREACAIVAAQVPFDLVICEAIGVGFSGEDVYRRLCALDERIRDRFVFMSGFAADECRRDTDILKDVPWLEKPVASSAVHAVLARQAAV